MRNRRGYALLAGGADFYFLALCLGAIGAFYVATAGRPLPLGAVFVVPLVALISSVAYHVTFARRTRWLSPGERMHGRIIADGAKHWTNPWRRNRWAMFSLNRLALVLLGNTWDGLAEGRPANVVQAIVSALYVLLVALGLVALGQGRAGGALGVGLLYLALTGATLYAAPMSADPQAVRQFSLVFVALGLLHLLVVAQYVRARRRAQTAASGQTPAPDTSGGAQAVP
jgi:hypothetical protein